MKHSKKILALVLSVAVVASIAAAGTLAWLTDAAGIKNDLSEPRARLTSSWTRKTTKIPEPEPKRAMSIRTSCLAPLWLRTPPCMLRPTAPPAMCSCLS